MANYVMKNLQVDLVGNTASVCICCDSSGKGPTTINMSFPLHVTGTYSENELRSQARDKVRLVLTRALESIQEDA